MSLQLQDVVDCIQVLYPTYNFLFLFDHSQGHARRRDGALNALNMSKGAQPRMRDSLIKENEGYLGPYSILLSVGDTQSLVWDTNGVASSTANPIGPWYINVLPRVRVVKCSARARAYICIYQYLEQQRQIQQVSVDPTTNDADADADAAPAIKQVMLLQDITKVMKEFKSHRSALGFDSGFINAEFQSAKRQQGTSDNERRSST